MVTGYERPFLGQGWGFPVGVDGKGGLVLSRSEHDIEQAIKIILGTPQGERVMRPEFGSKIHEFVFAPNNSTTAGLVAYYVREALDRWEPRIDVTGVDVQPDLTDPARLIINIKYSVRSTNDEVNMVYPFYLIPTEE